MEYILASMIGLIVLGVIFTLFLRRGTSAQEGRLNSEQPLGANKPSADEPTPAASHVSAATAEHAQQHTPPA